LLTLQLQLAVVKLKLAPFLALIGLQSTTGYCELKKSLAMMLDIQA
jgi:hypothetical protein